MWILLPMRSKSPLERHLFLQSGKVQKRWHKNEAFLRVGQKQTIRVGIVGNVFLQHARNDETVVLQFLLFMYMAKHPGQVSRTFSQFPFESMNLFLVPFKSVMWFNHRINLSQTAFEPRISLAFFRLE